MEVRRPAGDFDYETGGTGYARQRRPDPRIAAVVHAALGPAQSVVMAMVTVHQWPDPDAGLREMRRVARGPVVILAFDGDALDRLWLAHYSPELMAAERRRSPSIDQMLDVLGGGTATPVPVPLDCVDGFTEAYYGRPEQLLDPAVRRSQSSWGFITDAAEGRAIEALRDDLASGVWDRRWGQLRTQPEYVGALRLLVAEP